MAENQGLIVCGVVTVLAIVYVYFSWDILEPTDYGIDFSAISYTIGTMPFAAGRFWLGFGHSFIRFPARAQTIEFTETTGPFKRGEPLRSRTSDGLEVLLEISLQYQFQQNNILEAYGKFGEAYEPVYVRYVTDTVTKAATFYNASTFFSRRGDVAEGFRVAIESMFQDNAYTNALNFQLRKVVLPTAFEQAIQFTEVQRQDIRTAEAEELTQRVAGETLVRQAEQEAQSIVLRAEADAQTILLNNEAYVEQFNLTQSLQAQGFKTIYESLGSSEDQLLEYMRMRALRDHPASNSIISIQRSDKVAN